MTRWIFAVALSLSALASVPSLVRAQYYPSEPPPSYAPERSAHYRAHTGFFVRINPGLGGSGMRASEQGDTLTLRGVTGLFSAALGGSLSPRVILHGSYHLSTMFAPTAAFNGEDVTDDDVDDSIATHLLGGGMSFYTQRNVFVQVDAGLAFSVLEDASLDSSDAIGPGAGLAVKLGKEWFIGGQFGLGFAGQFMFTAIKDTEVDLEPIWYGTSLGMTASATFN